VALTKNFTPEETTVSWLRNKNGRFSYPPKGKGGSFRGRTPLGKPAGMWEEGYCRFHPHAELGGGSKEENLREFWRKMIWEAKARKRAKHHRRRNYSD